MFRVCVAIFGCGLRVVLLLPLTLVLVPLAHHFLQGSGLEGVAVGVLLSMWLPLGVFRGWPVARCGGWGVV